MRDDVARGPGEWALEPRPRGIEEKSAVRGCARTAEDQGQWTVVRRRLAARSRANRPSCQGVRWLVASALARSPRRTGDSSRAASASVYASAACFCDSSSRCTTASSTASRVGPSSWDVARRRTVRSADGSASRAARTASERGRPRLLNRRTHVPAPEAGHVLKAPDDVIPADHAEEEHIQGEGGGSDVAVPEDEPAEQAGMRGVGGIVEIAVAVHEEQEHVSVSQVGAGRNPFSAKHAVLVAERQVPRRVLRP